MFAPDGVLFPNVELGVDGFASSLYRQQQHTDKKENQIFLIYKEIQSGAVAKSYMRNGFLIYEEMRKYFPIYEEAVSDFALLHSETLIFFFISATKFIWTSWAQLCSLAETPKPPPPHPPATFGLIYVGAIGQPRSGRYRETSSIFADQ